MASASFAPAQADVTIARSSRRFGLKMPGVSTNTICVSPRMATPRTGMRVVCTLGVTMAILVPTSAFTSVDLPAFGAPMIAAKPHRVRHARSNFVNIVFAAACSASRFDPPSPDGRIMARHADLDFRIAARGRGLRASRSIDGRHWKLFAPLRPFLQRRLGDRACRGRASRTHRSSSARQTARAASIPPSR